MGRRAIFCVGLLVAAAVALAGAAQAEAKIAFVRATETFYDDVWTMSDDGSNQVNVTHSPGRHESAPSLSPDGTKIAYYEMGAGPAHEGSGAIWVPHADLWIHDLATGERERFVGGAWNALFGSEPSWSPDGSEIAYVAYDVTGATRETIWAKRVGHPGLGRPITLRGPHPDGQPTWSPDGRSIAFARALGGLRDEVWYWDIFVVPAGGGVPVNVTEEPGENDWQPAWSPDGSRLAYVHGAKIWTMRPDGSERRQLTPDEAGLFAYSPAWSPDGSKIAFTSGGEISVMNADGSGARVLASGNWPSWSR